MATSNADVVGKHGQTSLFKFLGHHQQWPRRKTAACDVYASCTELQNGIEPALHFFPVAQCQARCGVPRFPGDASGPCVQPHEFPEVALESPLIRQLPPSCRRAEFPCPVQFLLLT